MHRLPCPTHLVHGTRRVVAVFASSKCWFRRRCRRLTSAPRLPIRPPRNLRAGTISSPYASVNRVVEVQGSVAMLSFSYAFRAYSGAAGYPSPLTVFFGQTAVSTILTWNANVWTKATATFPIANPGSTTFPTAATATNGTTHAMLLFALSVVSGDKSILIDGIALTGYCALGSIPNPTPAYCLACDVGTYVDTYGMTSCSSCPAGSFASSRGSSSCTPCPAGTYSNGGAATCIPCPAGSYCPGPSNTAPTPCGTGTWSSDSASTCSQCSIAAVPSASYIMSGVTGSDTSYTYTCDFGYYSPRWTLTCGVAYGTITGASSTCTACRPPALNLTNTPSPNYNNNASTWLYACAAGYYGNSTSLVCANDRDNNVFSGSGPTCTACNINGGGVYCIGGGDTGGLNRQGQYTCPAGVYGLPSPAPPPTTASCSGPCTAGYYCPLGSITPTAVACGGAQVYCPPGSGAPIPVDAGYYSTSTAALPAAQTAMYRTGQAPCPANRQCSNGVILDAVDFTALCGASTGGSVTIPVYDGTTNAGFGPSIVPATPGYVGGMVYTMTGLTTADGACAVQPLSDGLGVYSSVTVPGLQAGWTLGQVWLNGGGQLQIGSAYTVLSQNCPNGFSFSITAAQSSNTALNATCAVTVQVKQVIRPPTFTACGPVSIGEHLGPGATASAPVAATTTNYGTAITYDIVNSTDFSINKCTGVIIGTRDFAWTLGTSYNVTVIAINDGTSIGLGKANTTCRATVNILQRPSPPVPALTSFAVNELSPIGTRIGSLGISDPAGYPITNVTWAAVDRPDAVVIDKFGNLTVGLVVDALVLAKTTWTYRVYISNPYITGTYTISVVFMAVPRPPTVFPQTVTISESAPGNTLITPILAATSSSNLTMTYAISPATTFGINGATGQLYLLPASVLNYRLTPVYTLTLTVSTTATSPSTATITVNVLEVGRSH